MAQKKKAVIFADPEKIEKTPVMDSLGDFSEAVEAIREALSKIEADMRDPLSALAWKEGHPVGHIMMTMQRPPTHNSTLYAALKRMGIDTRERLVTGIRKRSISPEPVPEQLQEVPADVLAFAEAARVFLAAREDSTAS